MFLDRWAGLLLILFLVSYVSNAQNASNDSSAAKPRPIQDNSFLIEEAYNQEPGIIQHINTFMYQRESREWLYTFTQEWPVLSQKHQLSFTIPVQHIVPGDYSSTGISDVAINYRYQLLGNLDSRIAASPRFSLLLPTGKSGKGMGAGSPSYQLNMPVSAVLSDHIVTHWNAGATISAGAKGPFGARENLKGYNLGSSIIWLTKPGFNVMFETFWSRADTYDNLGRKTFEKTMFLNPGIRWAHNFKNGLQIVPGIAFPIGAGPSKNEKGFFIYLSFEHPLK